MDKFIVYDFKDTPESIEFEYEIGERILVNSHIHMVCQEKKIIDGKLYQYFVSGRLVFD